MSSLFAQDMDHLAFRLAQDAENMRHCIEIKGRMSFRTFDDLAHAERQIDVAKARISQLRAELRNKENHHVAC